MEVDPDSILAARKVIRCKRRADAASEAEAEAEAASELNVMRR